MWNGDFALIEDSLLEQENKAKRFGLISGSRTHAPSTGLVSTTSAADTEGLCEVIDAIGTASCSIADLVAMSRMKNYHSRVGDLNFSGDNQTHLDVLSNKIFVDALRATGQVSTMLSEEEDSIIEGTPGGNLVVVFDPLDGSSNIECGLSVGTLFGIFKSTGTDDAKEVLQNGTNMVAAGYALYGAATTLVVATSSTEPVLSFCRDPNTGVFQKSGVIVMPTQPKKILSVNAGNFTKWEDNLSDFVQNAISGSDPYAFRYVGSFVADLHRTLLYGGLFMYPADSKNKSGKLRMLYECFPAAFVTEAAGGGAMSGPGNKRLLEQTPEDLHARCPVFLGSDRFVAELAGSVSEHAPQVASEPVCLSPVLQPMEHQRDELLSKPSSWSLGIVTEDFEDDDFCVSKGDSVLVDDVPLSDRAWVSIKLASENYNKRHVIQKSMITMAPVQLASSSHDGYRTAVVLGKWIGDSENGEMSVQEGQIVLVAPHRLSDLRWTTIHTLDMTESGVVPTEVLAMKSKNEIKGNIATNCVVVVQDVDGDCDNRELSACRGDVLRLAPMAAWPSDSSWIGVECLNNGTQTTKLVPKQAVVPMKVPMALDGDVGFGTAIALCNYCTDDDAMICKGEVLLVDPTPVNDKNWIRLCSLDLSERGIVVPHDVVELRMRPQSSANGTAFLKDIADVQYDLPCEALKSLALERGEACLTDEEALLTETGERTGRSANDRYIVETAENVAWGTINKKISTRAFHRLRASIVSHYKSTKLPLFVQDVVCGHDASEALPVRVVTTSAWHAQFTQTMFVDKDSKNEFKNKPFTVLHAPMYLADNTYEQELHSECFVIINFELREVLIGGTQYAGEIKKAIFSVMNYFLPQKGVLTLHSAANIGSDGRSALFFGLSGTGKTTLSADASRALIGDDETAWSDSGVFNLEGGCYAKLINITPETEPEIYSYCKNPMTILENVIVDDDMHPNFLHDDATAITKNTRGAYPLDLVQNLAEGANGGHPSHVIFLTCDASGVLPPVSRLTRSQAAYYFISGYTTKTSGTEVGVTEPIPTFSACFGEAFMPLHPAAYAKLLCEKLEQHGTQTWLLNTGWTGGAYGKGSRISLRHTRRMLDAVLRGEFDNVPMWKDSRFGLQIPNSCEGIPSTLLDPSDSWLSKVAYSKAANRLVDAFNKNFEKYKDQVSEDVLQAAPQKSSRPYLDHFLSTPHVTYRDYQKARIEASPVSYYMHNA
eukprot:m.331701 g.331701  ORF g.331701 m.331701 type:complete len:1225 (-) comp16782_c0_seq1:94-3768(-)